MKYSRVFIDAIGYELAPVVITTDELEEQIGPVFDALRIGRGQLQAWTGINERRWWEPGYRLSDGAIAAGKKALAAADVKAADLGAVVYTGVCREQFEPATACRVAHGLNVSGDALVYDLSNACLGVLNGIIDLANRIELGQIRAGLVVACESAREINQLMIEHLLAQPTMPEIARGLATLTGGSGAAAVLVTDGSFAAKHRKLVGAVARAEPAHHELCRWGVEHVSPFGLRQYMHTDAVSVLKHGVALGTQTWLSLMHELNWTPATVDKVICHQVGGEHRQQVLRALGINQKKDFSTFPFLGNIGTVSLPLTAAMAQQRGFLQSGDHVGFLGIGSGLNCLMLGVEW